MAKRPDPRAPRTGNAFTGGSGYSVDMTDMLVTERSKRVAVRQVAKLRAEGRDQSVAALKNQRHRAKKA